MVKVYIQDTRGLECFHNFNMHIYKNIHLTKGYVEEVILIF